MSHHRAAAGYLRTENIDLAVLEIEGLREAWAKVSTLPRPAAFRDQEKYTATMLDIAARLIGTTLVLNLGRTDVARKSLAAIRTSVSRAAAAEWRRRARRLRARRQRGDGRAVRARQGPGLGQRRSRRAIVSRHAAALRRHGAAGIRGHAEFRRLIDGALASLAQVPKAVETRDRDLLHRLLVELRSFDHLLAFRYG